MYIPILIFLFAALAFWLAFHSTKWERPEADATWSSDQSSEGAESGSPAPSKKATGARKKKKAKKKKAKKKKG